MNTLLSGNSKTLVIAAGAAVAAIGGLIYIMNGTQECSDTLLPALELAETQKIMAKILEKLKFVALKHSRAGQHIKMQLEQQGQQMADDDVMRHFILPHFENALEELQEEILAEFDVDEAELEEAARYYASRGDGMIQEITSKIQQMHKQFGGTNDGSGDSNSAGGEEVSGRDLTLEEVVGVLQTLSDKVGEATDNFVETFKSQHGLPNNQTLMMQFQQGMMEMSEQMESAVMEAFGLSQEVFQRSLMAHQNNPLLQQTVMAMQMTNQQRLASHGIQLQ